MKYTFTDKLIAYLALLSGLSLSAVAIYYSVAGLVSIFSAAVIPIIVMGVVLEVSKLIATIWLKINWTRAPYFIKAYMSAAIVVLMIITSMGIFGFLSKAHSDQSLVSGDVQSRIAVYDERIRTERENIEAGRKALKQMDATIDETIARSKTDQGAVNANAMRQRQAKERAQIQSDIVKSQKSIAAFNDERAPIAAEVRKVEAEVGPIKYIAAFVYGSNPDANILEKAVTWVIIIIVAVFDPLAVILLLASQYSFQWFRKQEEDTVPTEEHIAKEEEFKFLAEYKETLKQKPKDYDFFTGLYGAPPPYPLSEAELEEVTKAFEEARKKTHVEDIAVEQNISHPYTVPAQPAVTLITPTPTFNELSEADIVRLEAGQKLDFAPPGTPGEQWAITTDTVRSEQQQDNNLDKIYKASSEELAKKQRSRSWFQPLFPKKD